MPEIHTEQVARYLDSLLPPRDPLLADLEAQAARERIPIAGPHVGALLAMLVHLARPRAVLEVGTAVGYSSIWMGRALAAVGGTLQTIELRADRIAQARANLTRAGLSDVVEVIAGAALDVLAGLRGRRYGLIFLDAVKAEYPAYFTHALPLVEAGGLLVADNALLGGQVAGSRAGFWRDEDIEGIRAYNELAARHPELDTVVLPLRDGLTLSRRRARA